MTLDEVRMKSMRIVALFFCALTIFAGEQVSADSALFAPYQQTR